MFSYKVRLEFSEGLHSKEITDVCEFTIDSDTQLTYSSLKKQAYEDASKMEFSRSSEYIISFTYEQLF